MFGYHDGVALRVDRSQHKQSLLSFQELSERPTNVIRIKTANSEGKELLITKDKSLERIAAETAFARAVICAGCSSASRYDTHADQNG